MLTYAALIVLPGSIVRLCADHVTSPFEIRTIVLDDGSAIHLAPDSAIAANYTMAERRVRVLAGSGMIEVSQDSARPFIVSYREVEATATKARFAVSRQKSAVLVTVEAGSVRVSDAWRSQEVEAGFTLRVQKHDRTMMATVEPAFSGD